MNRSELNLIGVADAKRLRLSIYLVLISRILLGIAVLAVIMAVEIFATWQNLRVFVSAQQEQQELFEQRPEVVAAKEFEGSLSGTKTLVQKGNAFFENAIVWHELVQRVFEVIPSGITLESISFARQPEIQKKGEAKSKPAIQILLSGVASDRGSVRDFELALKELPDVLELQSPTQNIIPRADIPFRMTLLISIP